MANTLNTRVQTRYDTLTNWNVTNPVLLKGEIAVVADGGEIYIKVGDGRSNFQSLKYLYEPITTTMIDAAFNGA